MTTEKEKITIVRHKYSGLVLYANHWIELEPGLDKERFNPFRDIEYRGKCSEEIIDTNYFSSDDYEKPEWNEEDDIIDNYEEVEIEYE